MFGIDVCELMVYAWAGYDGVCLLCSRVDGLILLTGLFGWVLVCTWCGFLCVFFLGYFLCRFA